MTEKLENMYGKRSESTTEGLQRRFFSYTYDERKSAVQNCMEVIQISEDLTAANEPTRPGWVITRILGMLPPKLHHFRTAWDSAAAGDKTLDKLVERLRLEEDRLNDSGQGSGTSTSNALFTKTTGNPG